MLLFELYLPGLYDIAETADPFAEVEAEGTVADVLWAAEQEAVVTNFEANLIALTRMDGLSLQEVGDWLGVPKGRVQGRRPVPRGRSWDPR